MIGTTHAERIIAALRAKGAPMSLTELLAETKIPRHIMGVTLTSLFQSGGVDRPSRGVYSLAEKTRLDEGDLDVPVFQLIRDARRATPPIWFCPFSWLRKRASDQFGHVDSAALRQSLDRLAAAGKVRASQLHEGELAFELPSQYDPPGWPLPGATYPEGTVLDWRPRPPPHLTKEQAEAELAKYAPKFPTPGRLNHLLWPAPEIPKWARHCVQGPALPEGAEALLA